MTEKQKTKVLIVDDNKHMVKTISDILELEGYKTEAAFDGDRAVEQVKASGIDCVLMDVKMLGTDGLSALKKIRKLHSDLPVILMSGSITDNIIAEAKKLGALEVLDKPFRVDVVLGFLSRLKKSRPVRERSVHE